MCTACVCMSACLCVSYGLGSDRYNISDTGKGRTLNINSKYTKGNIKEFEYDALTNILKINMRSNVEYIN